MSQKKVKLIKIIIFSLFIIFLMPTMVFADYKLGNIQLLRQPSGETIISRTIHFEEIEYTISYTGEVILKGSDNKWYDSIYHFIYYLLEETSGEITDREIIPYHSIEPDVTNDNWGSYIKLDNLINKKFEYTEIAKDLGNPRDELNLKQPNDIEFNAIRHGLCDGLVTIYESETGEIIIEEDDYWYYAAYKDPLNGEAMISSGARYKIDPRPENAINLKDFGCTLDPSTGKKFFSVTIKREAADCIVSESGELIVQGDDGYWYYANYDVSNKNFENPFEKMVIKLKPGNAKYKIDRQPEKVIKKIDYFVIGMSYSEPDNNEDVFTLVWLGEDSTFNVKNASSSVRLCDGLQIIYLTEDKELLTAKKNDDGSYDWYYSEYVTDLGDELTLKAGKTIYGVGSKPEKVITLDSYRNHSYEFVKSRSDDEDNIIKNPETGDISENWLLHMGLILLYVLILYNSYTYSNYGHGWKCK